MHSLRDLLLSSWLNGLLVFVPIGLLTYIFKMSPILVFITNVIAIVPLSSLLTEATEMIASDAGDTVGALLNISLGNLVELILFVALVNNHIRIVQASILGSILVNLLPILGSALLASSLPGQNPNYNTNETQLLACLLFVSVFVFLMPTAFDYTYDHDGAEGAILQMSRISALMVLGIYLLYFVHELRNRNKRPVTPAGEDPVVEPRSMEEQPRTRSGSHPLPPRTIRFHDEASHPLSPLPEVTGPKSEEDGIELDSMDASISNVADARIRHSLDGAMSSMRPSTYQQAYRSVNPRPARSGSLSSVIDISPLESSASAVERVGLMRSGLTTLHRLREGRPSMESNAFEQPVPTKRHNGGHRVVSILVLILTSALMSMSAEFLVTTIDAVTRQGGLSEAVIGLIILPIVGNIAEYVTVVTVAARNKLDLAIAVAVGSSIQIALCVTPLTVLAGWILHRDLALTFNYFEMATLLGTVLLVNLLILNDGSSSLRTSGLKGALMCACYVIIG
ncbi:Sodium/calcium exchanger protein-domain-containing protein [Stachybotrys elegans]|uniref:Sodium/calcium exchanger protein-domain-containing protein n=1 Tax=Stachybotrys elegans TaxID=80388 RepID=A0A8K0WMB8_9HYPO|nr:Sodium/calcium exchanger protein-domain-containing protein [Stachybotrys elegans]